MVDQLDRVPRNKSLHIQSSKSSFDKSAKAVQWGDDRLFNKRGLGKWISTGKRMKLDPYLTTYTKIKMIKHLNVRPKIPKLLEENKAGCLGGSVS